MQPQPPIQKRESIINKSRKFSTSYKYREQGSHAEPMLSSNPTPQPKQYVYTEQKQQRQQFHQTQRPQYESERKYTQQPQRQQQRQTQRPRYEGEQRQSQQPQYNSDPYAMEIGEPELSPEQIEEYLHDEDQKEHPIREGDEREFMGGKKLYDKQLLQQPMYDDPTMQVLNDTSADESFPLLVQYITQLSHLGRQAQARLIVRASAFQSKNQVFSNIQNQNDYMMAQDDYMYAQILSKADYSTYDMNADYFTAEAVMEAQFNIRLRRSRGALNLLQLNTQRQESVMGGHPQQDEERKLSRKIPFLGSLSG